MPKRRLALNDYAKSSLTLADLLNKDLPFDVIDQVSIENHIHVVRLALGAWKRRNTPPEKGSKKSD